jgi:hypothetical protein
VGGGASALSTHLSLYLTRVALIEGFGTQFLPLPNSGDFSLLFFYRKSCEPGIGTALSSPGKSLALVLVVLGFAGCSRVLESFRRWG